MANAAKIAISIPRATLVWLEHARRRLGKPRSALVTMAVERWLSEHEPDPLDRAYVEGYRRQPESSGERAALAAVAAAAASTWEPWP
ncbi:MAG: hypothetical protein HY744_01615 [Deltaproteobacteria bacterium]|nr:hypothetical protein [Deltaproteobacteria bacterium]